MPPKTRMTEAEVQADVDRRTAEGKLNLVPDRQKPKRRKPDVHEPPSVRREGRDVTIGG
jgi:hypothetical protein